MIHVRDLDDDFYEFDDRSYSLVGKQSRKTYRMGGPVQVIIAAANIETKEIDLVFDLPKQTQQSIKNFKTKKKNRRTHPGKKSTGRKKRRN